MTPPKHHVQLSADVAAAPDEVFTFFTDHFDEIWPGRLEVVTPGAAEEPRGKGFVRRIHTPAVKLEEEIVTHDRPSLIEYRVVNEDDVPFHNQLGRIAFSERDGGTHVDYQVGFDYTPSVLGTIAGGFMKAAWAMKSKRALKKAFPGTGR